MEVDVTIGVQQPEKINAEVVKAVLPEGKINLNAVKGGLDVPNRGPEDITVIATAAIGVRLDLRSGASK